MENSVIVAIANQIAQVQQAPNRQHHLEIRIGQIVATSENALQNILDYFDSFIVLEQHMDKSDYRFEACIDPNDFQRASKNIKNDHKYQFTLDFTFLVTPTTKNIYRFGVDEHGEYFSQLRVKQDEGKKQDILDQGRAYRIALSTTQISENQPYKDILRKVIEDQEIGKQKGQGLQCVRYKETALYQRKNNIEKTIFKVQQISGKNAADTLQELYQLAVETDNIKKNLDRITQVLHKRSNYYKYIYEAEMIMNEPFLPNANNELAAQFIVAQARQFYDEIRDSPPQPDLQGIRFSKSKQSGQKFNYQKEQRGEYRTRGSNKQPQ